MDIITFKDKTYPAIQAHGFASQYAFAFAENFCNGVGVDVGYCKPEWKLPPANGTDHGKICSSVGVEFECDVNAMHMAAFGLDYIFSSHCLEHLPDYVAALDYWSTKLRPGGTLFLYLPNMDYQEYWNPANNRKHIHYLNPAIIQSYFDNRRDMWRNVFVTQGWDLNGSFYAVAEKI